MITNLFFYKDAQIIKGKNFAVDDIFDYLDESRSSALTRIEIEKFQMLKFERVMKIKVNMSEDKALSLKDNNYNYLWITASKYDSATQSYSDLNNYFYYVTHMQFLSESCVEVSIEMDVINTYCLHPASAASGYNGIILDKRTKVLREHKDRLSFVSKDSSNVVIKPQVDLYSEGLSPILYRKRDEVLTETGSVNDFYLIYRNKTNVESTEDLSNGVEAFVASKFAESIPAYADYKDKTFDLMFIDVGGLGGVPIQYNWECLYISYDDVGAATIVVYKRVDNVYVTVDTITLNSSTDFSVVFYYTWVNNAPKLNYSIYTSDNVYQGAHSYSSDIEFATGITSSNLSSFRIWSGNRAVHETFPFRRSEIEQLPIYKFSDGHPNFTLGNFEGMVDRTDSRLIKIIKIPYLPFRTSSFSNFMPSFKNNTLQMVSLPVSSFSGTVEINYGGKDNNHPLYPVKNKTYLISDISLSATRNNVYESKIYHSDFYQPKYYYDSFGYIVALEKVDNSNITATKTSFTFYVTSTINSRFMFYFNQINYGSKATEDFYNYLVVSRNNDTTILNQQYINYLRSGYNYDVKAKTRSEALNWAKVGAAAASGAAAGSYFGPAGTAVGAVAGFTMTLFSALKSNIDMEQSFAQKQAQLKMQAATVEGADDVDLMTDYCSNKLHLALYSVSDRVQNLLYDLFYYTGYICEELKVPSLSTRKWFNFVQCEPVFSYLPNVSEDIKQEIINKYNEGVTYLHNNSISGVPTWDFAQVKENWEVALYNSVNT